MVSSHLIVFGLGKRDGLESIMMLRVRIPNSAWTVTRVYELQYVVGNGTTKRARPRIRAVADISWSTRFICIF